MTPFIIGWVAGAIIVAVIADARGHHWVAYLFFGLALSPLVALIFALLEKPEGSTKVCPECAETIKTAARVCRHCGFRFAGEDEA